MEQVVFEPVMQKDTADCGIACLAMYLGVPYADVRKAAGRRLGKDGMTAAALVATAKKLRVELTTTTDFDDSGDYCGIVDLDRPKSKGGGHFVVYLRGMVWTAASGQLWTSLHTYCHDQGFKSAGLLTRRDV